jgi:hypothetical protein
MFAKRDMVTLEELELELTRRRRGAGPLLGFAYDDALAALSDAVHGGEQAGAGDGADIPFWLSDPQVTAFITARFGLLTIDEIESELAVRFASDRVPSRAAISRLYMRIAGELPQVQSSLNGGSKPN